jgi:3-oxoacyl-[acyl-carrier protein] reductase
MLIDDLKGKRVLITGASTGIGAALARAFAGQGAKVAIHYGKSADAAKELAREIGAPVLVQGELTKRGTGRRVVNEAVAKLGGLDILINNAGALVERAPIETIGDALVDDILELNVRAVIECTQAAIPHLIKANGGAIISVGSIAGSNGGGPGSGIYGGAKAFVHNLTRHLAGELAPSGIRVNCVSPGYIETPFHALTPADRKVAMAKATKLGRAGTPEDCVGVFLFLASNQMSGYITGQTIHVNGGQLMP